jgi:hypothetical protein
MDKKMDKKWTKNGQKMNKIKTSKNHFVTKIIIYGNKIQKK